MMPIRVRKPKVREVKVTKPKVRVLDANQVAAALGAEPTDAKIDSSPSPVSMFGLRQDIVRRLGLVSPDDTIHKKIRLSKSNWNSLRAIAKTISDELTTIDAANGHNITADEVASRLLHLALTEIQRESGEPANKSFIRALHEELIESEKKSESRYFLLCQSAAG